MFSGIFPQAINYSSWSDRFSSQWTFLFLLILAAITGLRHQMGPNAVCWSPADFRQQMTIYTDNICWLTREITPPNSDDIPTVGIDIYFEHQELERTLYQWLPLILAFQALFFRIPDITLCILESLLGFGFSKIGKMVNEYNTMTSSDKTILGQNLSQYLNQIFKSRPLKFIPIGAVTIIIGFVKLLIFINAVTQLSLLEGYLSPPDVTSYGEFVVNSIISDNYTAIAVSPVFPRKILCNFDVRQLQHVQTFKVPCTMPVNEFNEQVCFILWIWLLVVCVTSATSGVLFLVKSLIPMFRQRFVDKYLQMGNAIATPQQVNLFSGTDIGQDGILLLKMIGYISSDILVRDIILNLWYFKHVKLAAGQTLSQQRTNYNFDDKIEQLPEVDYSTREIIEMETPLLKHN